MSKPKPERVLPAVSVTTPPPSSPNFERWNVGRIGPLPKEQPKPKGQTK